MMLSWPNGATPGITRLRERIESPDVGLLSYIIQLQHVISCGNMDLHEEGINHAH